ncbi:hypothetical protein MPLA_740028 [Mesorhizobium sp. ORS 3359]|nr:hypothetical protein MPLA_740028 [Mesorhizobium sp. ORS 3359]
MSLPERACHDSSCEGQRRLTDRQAYRWLKQMELGEKLGISIGSRSFPGGVEEFPGRHVIAIPT